MVKITREQLEIVCQAFHKWFRVADLPNNADVNMWKAIDALPEDEETGYARAMEDALKEAGIVVDKDGNRKST